MNQCHPSRSHAYAWHSSRRSLVCGRFLIVVAVLIAAAVCAWPSIAFCDDCAASADEDCASRGLVVCEYDCSAGLCGGINPRCRWQCCVQAAGATDEPATEKGSP